MTRTIATCTQSETVNSIMEQMTEGKVRHVPVIEEERLVGIVSIGDVVKGPVAGLVGIEGGVVSGVFNLESPGVRAPGRRPRHDKRYHEA